MMPLWISVFSIPMLNHISLSILKVCLISLCLPPSFAMPSGAPAHTLPCCMFPSMCHDLAKWLSHYLYLFSFSFSFSFGLTIQEGVWESVTVT